jgi:flagellar protein FlaI
MEPVAELHTMERKLRLFGRVQNARQIERLESTLQQALSDDVRQKIAWLKQLASADIRWDKIIKTERIPYGEKWVYDLTVEPHHTFVANHLVAHNTSFMNVILPFIQPTQRILTIEDTRELQLPGFLHWVPMTTRESNQEGKGGVSMNDLLVNSLRMRPDRIIVGEIRRQRDAEVMFEAMHTGHSVYTTLHANTAEETIRRMTNPPIAIPATMLDSVHMNVVMFRNRRLGVRRVLELAEFVPEKRREGEETIKANVLFRWRGVDDKIVPHGTSIRLMDELELHTGLTKSEIEDDLKQKQRILDWLVQNNIHDINEIGVIMAEYYSDSAKVFDMVEKNIKPDIQVPEEYRTKISH